MAKILVVDDEPVIRELVGETLAIDSHEMSYAADGLEALAVVDQLVPDLVLLDVCLEGELNGLEVCRRITHAGSTKVILLSGMSDRLLRDQGPAAGATTYLLKPFSPLELIHQVETALEGL